MDFTCPTCNEPFESEWSYGDNVTCPTCKTEWQTDEEQDWHGLTAAWITEKVRDPMTKEQAEQLAAECKAEGIETKLIPCRDAHTKEPHTQVEVRGSVVRTLESARSMWNARKGKVRR